MNTQQWVVRPIQEADLPSILEIAGQVGHGFTSLHKNPETINFKISRSLSSFSGKLTPKTRFYFFVLEDVESHEIIGTAAIEACLGHPWPFYSYRISNIVQFSKSLKKHKKHQVLHLVNDYNGCTELETLFLKPTHRGLGAGEFLSRSRCLFIVQFKELFSDILMAEMRGIILPSATSPFWEAVGRHFFDMSFINANHHITTEKKQFLLDLMPKYPIYVDLLPKSAQAVIGETHESSRAALHVLTKEGFLFNHCVNIFDAGPAIEISFEHLKSFKESQSAIIHTCKRNIEEGRLMMISNTHFDFRVTLGRVELTEQNKVNITQDIANILHVSAGDQIRFCPFR